MCVVSSYFERGGIGREIERATETEREREPCKLDREGGGETDRRTERQTETDRDREKVREEDVNWRKPQQEEDTSQLRPGMCGVVCSLSAGMQLHVVQPRADADQNTQAIIYYSLNFLTGTKGDFK